ncbi:hypothetical protein BH11MYX4_BH11MYX4_33370 [soil metagenome]
MIRHISALAALVAMSLSTVACVAPTEQTDDGIEAEETSQDLVSRSAFFETFQGLDGHYYFNLTAGNGESVLRSQGYTKLASAEGGVASVLANGNDKRNFDVKQATNGDWFFNLVAGNGEIIGTSELYASKSNAERGGRSVRALVRLARDTTQGAPRRESFELFKGEDGKAYFHLRAANGELMLGSQAYASNTNARVGIASVLTNGTDAARYEIFETANGSYALRLVAKNGEIIARGQSYASKSGATRAVARLAEILGGNVKTTER